MSIKSDLVALTLVLFFVSVYTQPQVSVVLGIEQKCHGLFCTSISIVVAFGSLQTGAYMETQTLIPSQNANNIQNLNFYTAMSQDKTQFYVAISNPAPLISLNNFFIYNIRTQAITQYPIPYQISNQALSFIVVTSPSTVMLMYGPYLQTLDLSNGKLSGNLQIFNPLNYNNFQASAFDGSTKDLYVVTNSTTNSNCQYLVTVNLSNNKTTQSGCYPIGDQDNDYVLTNIFPYTAGTLLAVGVSNNGPQVGLFNPATLQWGKIFVNANFFGNLGVYYTNQNSVAFDKPTMTFAGLLQDGGGDGVLVDIILTNGQTYGTSTSMSSPQFGGFVLPY